MSVFQGMSSGFGDDESYNVYDKPWRGDRDMATSIYRPSKNIDKDVYGDDLDKLIKGSGNRFANVYQQLDIYRWGLLASPVSTMQYVLHVYHFNGT